MLRTIIYHFIKRVKVPFFCFAAFRAHQWATLENEKESRCRTHHHRPSQRPKAIVVYRTAIAGCAAWPAVCTCTPVPVHGATLLSQTRRRAEVAERRSHFAALPRAPLAFSHPSRHPHCCSLVLALSLLAAALRACSWLGVWPLRAHRLAR